MEHVAIVFVAVYTLVCIAENLADAAKRRF